MAFKGPQTPRYTRISLGANGDSGRRNICHISFLRTDLHAPQAASATGLATSLTLNTSAVTSQAITSNPDIPRNVTVTLAGTTANIGAGNIVITGTNNQGAIITESLVVTAATGGLLTGVKAFATVNTITYPATTGAGVTSTVGYGSALGLGAPNLTTGIVRVWAKTTVGPELNSNETLIAPTSSTLNATRTTPELNTVTVNGTLNGVINYYAYVLNYNWAVHPVPTKTVNVFGLS